MLVDASQTKRGWHQRRGRLAIWTPGLTIHVQLSVVTARPPAVQHGLDGRHVDTEQIAEWLEIWRRRHDGADVQIAIAPAVEALTDSRREGSSTVE